MTQSVKRLRRRAKPHPEHIHLPGDGRGPRRVTVNGVEQEHCTYADTRRGLAIVAMLPVRLDKHGKRVLTRHLRGVVAVTFPPFPI